MLRLGAVVVNVSSIEQAGAFWGEARAYVAQPESRASLAHPHQAGTRLHIDEDDRTHLDLWVDDAAEQQAEVERLVSLGARRVEWDYPYDADFVVLADPEGNLFCVVDASR